MTFIDWWLCTRYTELGVRAEPFYEITRHLESLGRPVTIVETGCVRQSGDWGGDGQSTVVWDKFVQYAGGSVFSVDIDPRAAALAHACTSDRTTVEANDSVAWLLRMSALGMVADLLYLDSYDIDWSDPGPSMRHHEREIRAAAPMLVPGSVVAVDDNKTDTGKGHLVGVYAEAHGWSTLVDGYVRAWLVE